MNTRTASFVCELATGLAIMGIVAVYNMGCAPMGSQPAREAANETRIATSSSGGGNAFATSQAVGRQQAELDQLRGIVTTLLGAQAAGRGLTAAERATLLAAARAITPAVASVATPRPAQTPATVTATPATAAPTPTFLPPSSMDAGMGLGMVGTGPGVPMPMPRVGVVNNVLFNGPTPWQNGNGLVGTTPFVISLIDIPYASEVLIDGIRTCATLGTAFTQMVVRGPTGGYSQICVAPPMPGTNQDLRALANGEGVHNVLIRYYSYSSYGGAVGQPVGQFATTVDTLSVFPHVVSATQYNMTH